jgi:hypothetical protein
MYLNFLLRITSLITSEFMTDCDTPCTICYIFHHILDDINWLEAYVPVLRTVLCILHIMYPSIVYSYDWAVNIAAKCYCLGLYPELFGQAVAIIHDLHDIHTFLYPYPIGHTFLRLHKYTVCWICLLHAAVMKGSKTPFTTSNNTMT